MFIYCVVFEVLNTCA